MSVATPDRTPGRPRPAPPSDELRDRANRARRMLAACEQCEWRCRVNRTTGEAAPCRLGDETYVFNQYLSLTEERELLPSLRVYLGGCNFRCRFCDTAPECFEPALGRRVEPKSTAREWDQAARRGARAVSLLGGEPTLHAATLLEIAAAAPRPLPLAINTNLYMAPEVIELLDGIVRLYLGDFKFGSDACARELAGVPHYVDVVRRNIGLIAGRTPLIVRHLLMPGHLDCCFRPVADWLAREHAGMRFELYTGYVPCWHAARAPRLGRLNARSESAEALAHLRALNLNWRAGSAGAECRRAGQTNAEEG